MLLSRVRKNVVHKSYDRLKKFKTKNQFHNKISYCSFLFVLTYSYIHSLVYQTTGVRLIIIVKATSLE